MSDAANIELVKRVYAAFGTGDVPALLDCLTPDIDWQWPSVKEIAHSGNRRGRDGVARCFELLGAAEEPVDFQQRAFISQGEHVVVLGWYKARAKATQRTYETDFVHAWTVRGDKLAKCQNLCDTAAAANAYRA
jgi:ketosteroid isomerase-like protein